MEKPLIIKLKRVPKKVYDYTKDTIVTKMNYEAGWADGTERQRDADAEWYEEEEREIFEEIDNHRYRATFDAWQTKCWGISDNDLQELKDKFLKEVI